MQFDKVKEVIMKLKSGDVAEVPNVNHAQKSVGTSKVSLLSSRIICVEVRSPSYLTSRNRCALIT